MSTEQTPAPAGGEALPEAFTHTPAGDGPLSIREAARSWSDARYKREAEETKPEEPQPEAQPPETELSAEDNAAPPEEAPGETQETEPAEELPPIDPPRSWTKDEKERFNTLPRETQEYIASREQERERDIRRSQNESAEQRKALEAELGKATQARQQYETALPILMENLQSAMAGEFSDIKTMADVQRMAADDFPRYVRWDAQQKQIAAVQQEIIASQQRQDADRRSKLQEFMASEGVKLVEALPELADRQKMSQAQESALAVLRDLGFKDDELGASYRGEKDISVHDHRFQRLVHEAALYRDGQAKAKVIKAKPLPPPQRPGTGKPAGSDTVSQIQALEKQLSTASPNQALRLGAQIMKLRRTG